MDTAESYGTEEVVGQAIQETPRSASLAIGVLQLFPYDVQADVSIDETKQVVFRFLIFDAEVLEHRFGTQGHDQQASVNGDEEERVQNACS